MSEEQNKYSLSKNTIYGFIAGILIPTISIIAPLVFDYIKMKPDFYYYVENSASFKNKTITSLKIENNNSYVEKNVQFIFSESDYSKSEISIHSELGEITPLVSKKDHRKIVSVGDLRARESLSVSIFTERDYEASFSWLPTQLNVKVVSGERVASYKKPESQKKTNLLYLLISLGSLATALSMIFLGNINKNRKETQPK